VIYEVSEEGVQVLAVIHGARLLPPEPPTKATVEPGDSADSP